MKCPECRIEMAERDDKWVCAVCRIEKEKMKLLKLFIFPKTIYLSHNNSNTDLFYTVDIV